MSVFTVLDLSAAFDTLDFSILLAWLREMFDMVRLSDGFRHTCQTESGPAVSVNGRLSLQKKLY